MAKRERAKCRHGRFELQSLLLTSIATPRTRSPRRTARRWQAPCQRSPSSAVGATSRPCSQLDPSRAGLRDIAFTKRVFGGREVEELHRACEGHVGRRRALCAHDFESALQRRRVQPASVSRALDPSLELTPSVGLCRPFRRLPVDEPTCGTIFDHNDAKSLNACCGRRHPWTRVGHPQRARLHELCRARGRIVVLELNHSAEFSTVSRVCSSHVAVREDHRDSRQLIATIRSGRSTTGEHRLTHGRLPSVDDRGHQRFSRTSD
jgi:hypothetical protein